MKTIALIIFLVSATLTMGQTGGTLDLSLNNVTGGARVSGAGIVVDSTLGQAVAGQVSTGGDIFIRTGFWAFESFAPTAANVSVGGRVTTSDGRGIPIVIVRMVSADGVTLQAITGPFGYYRFENVLAGETYLVQVSSKLYSFAEPVRVINVVNELWNVDFIGAIP